MAAHVVTPERCFTPTFSSMSTPGSIFLNRRSNFTPKSYETYHYKLEQFTPQPKANTLPNKRRATMNITFTTSKNEIDPYIHASNWLPRFKSICKGFLVRKRAKELKEKHENVRIIQKACVLFIDPWFQLFLELSPTLKTYELDELKKYLKECVIRIKSLNAQRNYIESELKEIEEIMDQSLKINDSTALTVDMGKKSPNIFKNISDINDESIKDDLVKRILKLNIDGIKEAESQFDSVVTTDTKVNSLHDLADKLMQRINEDRYRYKNLREKCEHLEHEIKDLRQTNSTLDTSARMLRGIISKTEKDAQSVKEKLEECTGKYEILLIEKKAILGKIKEFEKSIINKNEIIEIATNKSQHFEDELDKKLKLIQSMLLEKSKQDQKIQELTDSLNYNNEIQVELESTIEQQKGRLRELKKRLTDQIKATEDELTQQNNELKQKILEMVEFIDGQNEKIKQHENVIWRLEQQVSDARRHDLSDDEPDYDRERKLSLQLKNTTASLESVKDDLKLAENNCLELKKTISEMEATLETTNSEMVECKKNNERLKSQYQTLKSNFGETELKFNRCNREKNFLSQKCSQYKERNEDLEAEILKIQESLSTYNQNVIQRNREIDTLQLEISEMKKEYENKIQHYEQNNWDLTDQVDHNAERVSNLEEEVKRIKEENRRLHEELQQTIDDRDDQMEQSRLSKLEDATTIKKLQRHITDYEDIQRENEKTISKLKDEVKTLQEENETRWSEPVTTQADYTRFFETRTGSLKSPSSMTCTSSPHEDYFTLPGRRSKRY